MKGTTETPPPQPRALPHTSIPSYVPTFLDDRKTSPAMSDDAAQQAHESTAQEAVGTTRKATGEPAGASERAAPKPKVSAEDLARALGVGAATAAVKAEAKESPNFGLKEVRDEVTQILANSFQKQKTPLFAIPASRGIPLDSNQCAR